jgi:hypothetical protein
MTAREALALPGEDASTQFSYSVIEALGFVWSLGAWKLGFRRANRTRTLRLIPSRRIAGYL